MWVKEFYWFWKVLIKFELKGLDKIIFHNYMLKGGSMRFFHEFNSSGRVRNLLFRSFDLCSFALGALLKRATTSESLLSLFTKDRLWANRSDFFKQEQRQWFARDLRKSLSKNEQFARKKLLFVCFWQLFPILCQKMERLQSLFALF